MAKKKNRDQIIVRISMENGVPRVRPLTAKEQKQFIKTHPKSKLPTFSLSDVNQGMTNLEQMAQIMDPRTISVVNDPSAR